MNIKTLLKAELKRLGFHETDNELEQISLIQQYFAEQFTFENLDVLLENEQPIDEDFLTDKLLIQKRGGLCYELNGFLYYVLKALGFEVVLASATIWTGSFWGADRTHSIVLFYSEDKLYLVDSGTGTNLPMKPVLLDGEPVTSSVGAFRLRQDETGNGTVVAEWLSEDGWIWQYGFYPEARPLPDELNRSKKMIHEMKESPFNKALLIAKSLPDGTVSINEERMSRKWIGGNGLVEKEERIEFENNGEILMAVKEYASEATLNKVKIYLDQNF